MDIAKKKRNDYQIVPFFIPTQSGLDFDRLGFGQTQNFVFGNTALGTEDVQTFITFHDVTDFADLATNAETRMLRHFFTSYF